MRLHSDSPNARPDRARARLEPPVAVEEGDDVGWLTTFADVVLQLFAFVILASALGGSSRVLAGRIAPEDPVASAPAKPAPVAPAPAAAAPASSRDAGPGPAAAPVAAARPALAPTAAMAPTPVAAPPDEPEPERMPVAPSLVVSGSAASAGDDASARRAAVLAETATRLEALAVAAGQRDAVSVTTRGSQVVVGLGEAIAFPSGSAELLPEAEALLGQVRTLARAMPDLSIEVTGHTDDRPIATVAYPSNLELSLARAARVARALEADPSLAGRVTARGVGAHRPMAPNDDAAGRARNRRVEIRLAPAADG